jgi:hypothetical protein
MALEARAAALEWALQMARGELSGTDWVDARLTDLPPYRVTRDEGRARFRHLSLTDGLPSPMVDAAVDAQNDGEFTALEGLTRLFARVQWLTSARRFVWTPSSPVPHLLAALVEAYGVDAELHRHDPESLAKLLVHLPRWFPRRGQPGPAVELLAVALDDRVPVRVGGTGPAAFTCQSASWWAERRQPTALTLVGGIVRMQAVNDPEDTVLGWVPGDRFPHELLRLLPAFASVRLALEDR